jgi:hypothetical protein
MRWLLALWLPWAILIDYVSLFKPRVILRILGQTNLQICAIAILCIDIFVYVVIFYIGLLLLATIADVVYLGDLMILTTRDFWYLYMMRLLQYFDTVSALVENIPIHIGPLPFPFIAFWSGFVPSIWMWLYLLALFVTRGLLRSERIVNWLRWALDVEKNPFRSIGAVAAALAFIASVATILVSAEVSRITAL